MSEPDVLQPSLSGRLNTKRDETYRNTMFTSADVNIDPSTPRATGQQAFENV